jgi:hypothetical protein
MRVTRHVIGSRGDGEEPRSCKLRLLVQESALQLRGPSARLASLDDKLGAPSRFIAIVPTVILSADIQNELCDSGRCIEPHAGRLELHAFAFARTWIESDSDTAAFRLQDQFSHLEPVG